MASKSNLAKLFAPETSMLAQSADGTAVEKALRTLRTHLSMDLAFISEFGRENRTFHYVDTILSSPPIQPGDKLPMDAGYCQNVVQGRLPQLIPDTADCADAIAIPATSAIPIGAHISVPLHRLNGEVYGTLCCFSLKPDPTLTPRDLEITHAFAELIGQQIEGEMRGEIELAEKFQRIGELLCSQDPVIVYQPIWRLAGMDLVGCEALARFSTLPIQSPDRWFAEAGDAGLRSELEFKAIDSALRGFSSIWDKDPIDLSLNSSPQTIIEGGLNELLADWPAERLILEITEHDHVSDYGLLVRALTPLKARGIRIAIDDAGSGFASMRHILEIGPDIIKLDVSLTRDIDTDPRKRALAAAFVTFGHQIGSKIIGEGVETAAELETLRALGVDKGQGYFIGRPVDVSVVARDVADRKCGKPVSDF